MQKFENAANNNNKAMHPRKPKKTSNIRHLLMYCVIVWSIIGFSPVIKALPVHDPGLPGPYNTSGQHDLTITNPNTGDNLALTVIYPGIRTILDPRGAPYPVVILNHGFQLTKDTLYNYARLLASWGYVTVLPERPRLQFDNTALVRDLSSVIDWIEEQHRDSNTRYYQLLDLFRIGMAGHSQGGKLSFATAYSDPRVKVLVGLDPVDSSMAPQVTPGLMPDIQVPFLVLGTDIANDMCNPRAFNFQQFYRYGKAPKAEVTVIGGDHCALLDYEHLFCVACPNGTDNSRQKELCERWTVAWFNRFLLGEADFDTYCWGPEAEKEVLNGSVLLQYERGIINPTPTPSPTMASPTLTPEPSSTPTNTAKHYISLAGYMATDLRQNERGRLEIVALITENAVDTVLLLWEGAPTEITLTDASAFEPDDGWYGWSLEPLQGVPILDKFLFEIEAIVNGQGYTIQWPYLSVE